MRERVEEYLKHIDEVTSKELTEDEKKFVLDDLLVQIRFYQNERLIHLIVTVTFAIISIFTTLINYYFVNLWVFAFLLVMYILLSFYIRHYFFLERSVQKMYLYYDKLVNNDYFSDDVKKKLSLV